MSMLEGLQVTGFDSTELHVAGSLDLRALPTNGYVMLIMGYNLSCFWEKKYIWGFN